jgi:hypothetical protein
MTYISIKKGGVNPLFKFILASLTLHCQELVASGNNMASGRPKAILESGITLLGLMLIEIDGIPLHAKIRDSGTGIGNVKTSLDLTLGKLFTSLEGRENTIHLGNVSHNVTFLSLFPTHLMCVWTYIMPLQNECQALF